MPCPPLMLPTSLPPPPPWTRFRSWWGTGGRLAVGHGSGAGGALGGTLWSDTVPELAGHWGAHCGWTRFWSYRGIGGRLAVGHGSGALSLISGSSPQFPHSPRYSSPHASQACRCYSCDPPLRRHAIHACLHVCVCVCECVRGAASTRTPCIRRLGMKGC